MQLTVHCGCSPFFWQHSVLHPLNLVSPVLALLTWTLLHLPAAGLVPVTKHDNKGYFFYTICGCSLSDTRYLQWFLWTWYCIYMGSKHDGKCNQLSDFYLLKTDSGPWIPSNHVLVLRPCSHSAARPVAGAV